MPNIFYLNDSLPKQPSGGANVVALFGRMVSEYKKLHENTILELAPYWVTRDCVENVTICSMPLMHLLRQFKNNPTLFTYASKLVRGYPPLIIQEEQLAGDPELVMDCMCDSHDAHYLLVAQKMDMIAASLPVEAGLCSDILDIVLTDLQRNTRKQKQINNWYVENSQAITQLLTPPLPPKTEPWNRLTKMLERRGKIFYSKIFEDDWNHLGSEIQRLVVQRFEDALNGNLLFPAKDTNKNIVKPDEHDRSSKVHELRQIGSGFRIYFECDNDAIYLALFASKTIHHGKDQKADFKYAKTVVDRLRKGIR